MALVMSVSLPAILHLKVVLQVVILMLKVDAQVVATMPATVTVYV